MKKVIIEILYIAMMLIYTFNDLFETIKIRDVRYILGFITIILGVVFLVRKNQLKQKLWTFYLFFLWGIELLLLSVFAKGVVPALMGFVSIYFNLAVWIIIAVTIQDWTQLFIKYKKFYVYGMVVNSILAIYQYFFDASIFGLATHKLYSLESSFSNANVARRATALMGSPQNYAVAVGVALFMAYDLAKNKKCSWWNLLPIFVGGCLSGARTYGIFVILFVLGIVLEYKDVIFNRKYKLIIIPSAILGVILVSKLNIFSLEVFSRMFAFSRWAALSVYFDNFKNLTLVEWLFGRGFGLNEWGTSVGSLSFDYSSVESYIVALFYQGGGVLLAAFVIIIIMALSKIKVSNKREFCLVIAILINAMTTPAFAGFSISFLIWPIILNYYLGDDKRLEGLNI